MKKAIEKYKKFIFLYVLINLFALIVNAFNIDSHSYFGSTPFNHDRQDVTEIYYLTKYNSQIIYGHDYSQVWPFVSFINEGRVLDYNYTDITFNGIFYQYDISEFLLYIGILIAFLVYKAYIEKSPVIKKT